jgi:hypothetical protein
MAEIAGLHAGAWPSRADDYLRRRDLSACDEGERTLQRRKEQARVEFLRSHFGACSVVSITARSVEGSSGS